MRGQRYSDEQKEELYNINSTKELKQWAIDNERNYPAVYNYHFALKQKEKLSVKNQLIKLDTEIVSNSTKVIEKIKRSIIKIGNVPIEFPTNKIKIAGVEIEF